MTSDKSEPRHKASDTPGGRPEQGRTRVRPGTGEWTPGTDESQSGKGRHASGKSNS